MSIFGPEGNVGSLTPSFKYVKNWIVGRKKTDVRCATCGGKGFHGCKTLPSEPTVSHIEGVHDTTSETTYL